MALGDGTGLCAWGFEFSHRLDVRMGFPSHNLKPSLLPKKRTLACEAFLATLQVI